MKGFLEQKLENGLWARIGELLLAVWLLFSSLIFETTTLLRVSDISCGAILLLFSWLSFYRPFHFGNLGIGLWLFFIGYFFESPLPNSVQNDILIGLLLLILATVPRKNAFFLKQH